MRYEGNLAYKTDYIYEVQRERTLPVKREMTRQQAAKATEALNRSNNRRKTMQLLRRTSYIIVICLAATFMITKYVQLDALDRQVKSLEREVESMRSATSQKIIEMDQGIDLAYIEDRATSELNMKRPEKYQQIYVDVKRNDVTDVTAKEAESIITRVKEFGQKIVSNIVDRFSIR